ncbi:tetracycline resistance MFS efflux pump [Pleomorphomonas diazotrophica]|uniref:Tetracycline resistance MFS efflux pump n=1 Tax=Pleomorphomonas diazotrophica TaxID=1166257 RepID=A0A1I4W8A1_9HYPH|nr:TCR/Tet family MFS transporter [Pleomorphomonas diazotrophica]PKR87952.1 tetracycline resistance MFS efflux pump [Pleomorphomonas diazotrophica]SFN09868.1 MFS transporter, DHA1 family, tetracycline resistance protein [Pleomorphomonas diazotrophica]
MNRPLIVIYAAIVLDAVGIGLIFPILPALLSEVTHAGNVATTIGIMTALYAAVQFVFAPVLGALSDRIGRRPVLLISLAGAAINYLFLAFAGNLALLFLGRAIAGLTSANVSVATAYITDITQEDQRARRFGLLNAMFGIGFIVGPVLGGTLGDHWLRLPFIAAAVLNGVNLLIALFILPESREPSHQRLDLAALNPLKPLAWVFQVKSLWPLIVIFFLLSATGEAYGTSWALWGGDAFGWNGMMIGLSLGAFGVCQTLAQAFLPGPAVKLMGERAAILTGLSGAMAALAIMAFATEGWIVFAIMPLFALGGLGVPALQAMATRQVSESQQGQFQGVLASALSLASIVAPLGFSSFYAVVREEWPGAVWLSVVAVYAVAMVLVGRRR